jgi:hypothetical protein
MRGVLRAALRNDNPDGNAIGMETVPPPRFKPGFRVAASWV